MAETENAPRPIHAWNVGPVSFQGVIDLERRAEYRRAGEDIRVGDLAELHLVDPANGQRLGVYCTVRVTHVQPAGPQEARGQVASFEPHTHRRTGASGWLGQWIFAASAVPPASMIGPAPGGA